MSRAKPIKRSWIGSRKNSSIGLSSKDSFLTFLICELWKIVPHIQSEYWNSPIMSCTFFMPTYMVSVYEIAICRVVAVRRTLDPPRIFGAHKSDWKDNGSDSATSLYNQGSLEAATLVSCLDDDAFDDCKLFKVCFVFKYKKAYSHNMLQTRKVHRPNTFMRAWVTDLRVDQR